MGYKDKIDVQAHDFSQTTTKVGNHEVQGMHMLRVTPAAERVTTPSASDGFTWFEKNPDRSGEIMIQIPENSPSIDVLWDLYDADEAFAFSHSDPNSPKMKVNDSLCRLLRPTIERDKAVKFIEWTMRVTYLNYRGGGYTLVEI